MNISEKTKEVLKNFSGINASFLIRKGTKQSTVSVDSTVYAEAVLPDDFSNELAIYDLPGFLSNISLLNSPTLEFNGTAITLTDKDNFTVSYRGCDKTIIHYPADGMGDSIAIDNPDIEFTLNLSDLQKLLKVAQTNTFSHLTLFAKNGKLAIKVDNRSAEDNSGVMTLETPIDKPDFKCEFKVEHLKMLPMNYNVKVKNGAFAIFENNEKTLKYIIAIDVKKKGAK